ncbi:membrane protein [Pararhizobium polonicum]|uniref:Porin n=1 Tax=Pararhizobium polonicum TaxID=1612624 RepID=A0A1C7P7S6_9HYPH|nr:porin [Pararhizobium polonicum]OBZ97257.1 membrane protein [Pararhizobium polonicum]
MTIKAFLFASAAALSTASGAVAADAIVAAEPEPLEYVRVCDAFGTGYFYIPGTETCLKIGGYIRFQTDFGRDQSGTSDWNTFTRAQLEFTAKNDTEFGTLTSLVALRTNARNSSGSSANDTFLDQGYFEIAGFRVGMQYSWWDDDLSGETDFIASNETRHNAIRYQYETDAFKAGIAVEELEDSYATKRGEGPNNVGVTGQISGTVGGVSAYLLGGYDTDTEEGAIRAIVYADIGPGQLGVYGAYATGANYYYEESEWTAGAQYELKVNDKFAITPGFQYFGKIALSDNGEGFRGGDAWRAGVTVDYKITDGLKTKLSVQYQDVDNADDEVFGFLRLQRDF